jgi:hypothetical protein
MRNAHTKKKLSVLAILGAALLLAGCKDRELEERTKQVKAFSDREDHLYTQQAVHEIEKQYWTLRDGVWLGKTDDGTIVRLEHPKAQTAPLPSRSFYSGWHLQLTITSDDWRTYPPSDTSQPFEATYAVTRHSATNWQIDMGNGIVTVPLKKADIVSYDAQQ